MKPVPFTQFLRPNGLRRETSIEVSDEAFAAWEKIFALGFRMTCEELTTGHASLCIEDPELGDFDCHVIPNTPGVRGAVEKMLLGFTEEAAKIWREEMT